MRFGEPNLQLVAGGTIRVSRIVKISSAADNTALESASATSPNFGIAQEGSRRAPGTGDDDGNAAIATENIMVYSAGSGLAPVRLGGTVTSGDAVTSDANALGVTTTTEGDFIVGWAFQSGVSGDVIAVLCQPTYYAS